MADPLNRIRVRRRFTASLRRENCSGSAARSPDIRGPFRFATKSLLYNRYKMFGATSLFYGKITRRENQPERCRDDDERCNLKQAHSSPLLCAAEILGFGSRRKN